MAFMYFPRVGWLPAKEVMPMRKLLELASRFAARLLAELVIRLMDL